MTRLDTIAVRIPKDLYEAIKAIAEKETEESGLPRSVTKQIEAMLRKGVGKYKEES